MEKWEENIIYFVLAVSSENLANRILAKGGGIVLLNVTQEDMGQWMCKSTELDEEEGNYWTVEYSLQLDGGKIINREILVSFTIILEDCAKPKNVGQFHAAQREWCRRMDAYRTNLSKWQSLYEGGGNCPNTMNDNLMERENGQQNNNIQR